MRKIIVLALVYLGVIGCAPSAGQFGDFVESDASRPEYIAALNPSEGSEIDIELFNLDKSKEYYEETLIEVNPLALNQENVGHGSRICIRLDLTTLGKPNDNFTPEIIQQRIRMTVNGNPIDRIDYYDYEATQNIAYFEEGSFVYPGLTDICWGINLGAGTHTAQFEFEQTGGPVQSYMWFFTLV